MCYLLTQVDLELLWQRFLLKCSSTCIQLWKKSYFNPYIHTTIKPDLYIMTRTVQMHSVKKCYSNVLHSSPKDQKMLRNNEDLSFSISIQEIFYPFLLLLLLKYKELLNSSTSVADLGTKVPYSKFQFWSVYTYPAVYSA